MAAPQQLSEKKLYTEDEYFAFLETAEERWEFIPVGPGRADGSGLGRIRQVAGGMPDHAAIIANVTRTLGNALLPRGCRVFSGDLNVQTGDDINTFPDVSVVCGPLAFHPRRRGTITNPLVVVEVLSPSTMGYDLGDKFAHYQTIPSLAEYLLVFQDQARAILHSRAGDHWETRIVAGLEGAIRLPSVDVTLALADVYVQVEFEGDGVESEGPDGPV